MSSSSNDAARLRETEKRLKLHQAGTLSTQAFIGAVSGVVSGKRKLSEGDAGLYTLAVLLNFVTGAGAGEPEPKSAKTGPAKPADAPVPAPKVPKPAEKKKSQKSGQGDGKHRNTAQPSLFAFGVVIGKNLQCTF